MLASAKSNSNSLVTVSVSLVLVKAKFGINSFMPRETCARERVMKPAVFVCYEFGVDQGKCRV